MKGKSRIIPERSRKGGGRTEMHSAVDFAISKIKDIPAKRKALLDAGDTTHLTTAPASKASVT